MQNDETQNPSTTGTVEWYDNERDTGSIRPDDGAAECSIRPGARRSAEMDSLNAGDRVTFSIQEAGGERTATNLARLRAFQRWEDEGGAILPPEEPAG